MGFQWDITPGVAFSTMMDKYADYVDAGVLAIVDRRAPEITAWMKANHPWQNQTGAAEAGLHTEVEHIARQSVTLVLAHGENIQYAVYLEYKFQGRDAVIAPAIDYWGPVIMADVKELLRV